MKTKKTKKFFAWYILKIKQKEPKSEPAANVLVVILFIGMVVKQLWTLGL